MNQKPSSLPICQPIQNSTQHTNPKKDSTQKERKRMKDQVRKILIDKANDTRLKKKKTSENNGFFFFDQQN